MEIDENISESNSKGSTENGAKRNWVKRRRLISKNKTPARN
jgi:hypothetical protein